MFYSSNPYTMTLIIGATGKLGRAITDLLLEEGYPVRAMTRQPEKAADLRARGVEVVSGDLIDAASLREALTGPTSSLRRPIPFWGAVATLPSGSMAPDTARSSTWRGRRA